MPHTLRVSMLSGECLFNTIVFLELIKLDGGTVLHAVNRDTRFSVACFLEFETVGSVWDAFICIWVALYVG